MDKKEIQDMIKNWEDVVKRIEALPPDSPIMTEEDREAWAVNKDQMTSFFKRLGDKMPK